eukprot:s88_g4.t1
MVLQASCLLDLSLDTAMDSLAAQVGVTRFRQKLFWEDGSEIEDDEVFTPLPVKIQLLVLEFWPPHAEQDRKMISAAWKGDSVSLEKLLKSPRDPNVIHAVGFTPLHAVAIQGHLEAVRLLLEAGAELETRITAIDGTVPLHLAACYGHLDVVRVLVEAGAEKDQPATDSELTPLYAAVDRGHLDVLRFLVEAGAKTETVGHNSPLHFAAKKGHLDIVSFLIDIGANKDEPKTDTGHTPLHVAAIRGHLDVVRLLVESGADHHVTARDGKAPSDVASEQGHDEIVRFLAELRRKSNGLGWEWSYGRLTWAGFICRGVLFDDAVAGTGRIVMATRSASRDSVVAQNSHDWVPIRFPKQWNSQGSLSRRSSSIRLGSLQIAILWKRSVGSSGNCLREPERGGEMEPRWSRDDAIWALKAACSAAETSLRGPCCQRAAASDEDLFERSEVAQAVAAASKELQRQRNAQAKGTAAARSELFKGSQPSSRKTNTLPQDSSWKTKSKERQKETKKDKAAWKAAKEAKAASAAAAAAATRKEKKVAAKEALKAEEVLKEKSGAAEVDSQMAKGSFDEASGEMGLEFHEDRSGTGEGQDWADALKAGGLVFFSGLVLRQPLQVRIWDQ